MRTKAIVAAFLILTACTPDLSEEVTALQAEQTRQAAEIDRLRQFIDAQASVLNVCQQAMADFSDYLVNSNTIGMFRDAGEKLEQFTECSDAMTRFNEVAAAQGVDLEPGP